MSAYFLRRATVAALLLATACAGPGSIVEVNHARDMVKEGQLSYLEDLLKGLGSKDPAVQAACVNALGAIGEPAIADLHDVVEEQSPRSGPALLALGLTGDPNQAAYIRRHTQTLGLEESAKAALETLEKSLYDRAVNGDLEAMDGYLSAFPQSPRAPAIQKARGARVASLAYEQASKTSTIEAFDAFLAKYSQAADAIDARSNLSRLLIQLGWQMRKDGRFDEARKSAARAAEVDPQRADDAKQITGGSWLDEGASLRKAGNVSASLAAYQHAAEVTAFRLEAERAQGDILLEGAQKQLAAGKSLEAIASMDQAVKRDPSRRPDVARQKAQLQVGFTQSLTSTDPATARDGLLGLIFLGDEARPVLETYFVGLFSRKDFAALEKSVQILSEARKLATPEQQEAPVHAIDLFGSLLRSSLAQTSSEVTRLLSTPEFSQGWKPDLDVTDPRQYPLVFRVEEVMTRHFGLARVGVTMKVLLGESVIDIVKGSLLSDDECQNRLKLGQIGEDPSLPLLTRVQLSARYSSRLATLRRTLSAHPDRFMAYAAGWTLLPATPADWLTIADGFERFDKSASTGQPVLLDPLRSSVHNGASLLFVLEKDARSVTLKVTDPTATSPDTPEGQKAIANRTLALLLNTARAAFGLYPGIDRYTVMVGSLDARAVNVWPVTDGHFEPEARLMMSQKTFSKQDWRALKSLNGAYGSNELSQLDLQWYRWSKR